MKLSSIPGTGWDNIYLVRGLKATHIRRRVANQQDFWRTMQDVFDTANCITRMEEKTKIYSEPNFELVPQVSKEWVQELGTGKYTGTNPPHKTYSGPQHRLPTNSNFRSRSRQYNSQPHRDHSSYQPN